MTVDVLLPVYNEVSNIEAVIKSILKFMQDWPYKARLVVCEDGSTDGTPDLLRKLAGLYPIIKLNQSTKRKGYSKALLDAFKMSDADIVITMDSDGQYEPSDMGRLLAAYREGQVGYGKRSPRQDPKERVICSQIFLKLFQLFFNKTPSDPTCPMVLIPRQVLQLMLQQIWQSHSGFWWEFAGKMCRLNVPFYELNIQHHRRLTGQSTYQRRHYASIFFSHLWVICRLRFS